MGSGQFSFLLFLCLLSFSSSIPHPCRKDQSISLLKFKKTFTVNSTASDSNVCEIFYGQKPYPKTSSWNMSIDCCSWDGVICDEMTGHVIELDLGCSCLVGKLDSNSSLFQLSHLQRLNLSVNNFSRVDSIPLQSLDTIDLRSNLLQGSLPIPPISTRFFLIAHNNLTEEIPSHICNLKSLVMLDLARNNLKGAIPQCLGNIRSLKILDMHNNKLSGTLPTTFSNGSSLRKLNLRGNKLEGKIPRSLANCKVLQVLDLGDNHIIDTFPMWVGTLPKLHVLSLRLNKLHGPIRTLKNENMFPDLRIIDLSYNAFTGNLPTSLFRHLKTMRTIDPSKKKLTYLEDYYYQDSIIVISKGYEIELIKILTVYASIDLSSNKFEGHIPSIMGELTALKALNFSHNRLQGRIPSSLGNLSLVGSLDLSVNQLSGEIPKQLASLKYLEYFFTSENNLTEEIPSSICNLTSLVILDLARNNLKGVIPQCLGNITGLVVLDMHNNNLSGTLPTIFSNGRSLRSLNLHGNKLEGNIPRSLSNCKALQVLDLGHNHLNDTFPMWLGTLPDLQVLSLRSNKLYGSIPPSSVGSMFPKLRIIDLSYNAFSGNLPTSLFQHLKTMRTIDPSKTALIDGYYYQDSVVVVTKGLELEVERILFLYTTMDLSNNNFEGHIPDVIGDLIALRMLNFSHNRLQGHIPSSLGNLFVVESLNLSFNQLSGEIPQQLASLTSLAVLNLSHNHLQGCIPKGPQFNTFEINSYEGNDGLCGYPFPQGCGSSRMPETENTAYVLDEESNSTFLSEFWNGILMGYGSGLIIGFSIASFMLSSRNSNWLSRIAEELEYRIVMRRRKKKQGHHRR
ncbi:receptor-like protein 12 [Solanum tuberosum]|uniref:Hcr2-0B n=1 Tax=Solanum tuberosum TaxID=4113 RepID=M1A0M2_SOLTU|nr:PREDICTED: receptor-like protein 12 [Solanum tuberosum]